MREQLMNDTSMMYPKKVSCLLVQGSAQKIPLIRSLKVVNLGFICMSRKVNSGLPYGSLQISQSQIQQTLLANGAL